MAFTHPRDPILRLAQGQAVHMVYQVIKPSWVHLDAKQEGCYESGFFEFICVSKYLVKLPFSALSPSKLI